MYFNFLPENCKYRGEGNTSLVISLKKEEKVLRLLKYEDSSENSKSADQLLLEMEEEIAMIKNVMKPVLGNDLINCPVIIPLQAENMKFFNTIISSQRPSYRVHKNVKEDKTYGLLLPDYCTLPPDLKSLPSVGPVLSIEIKPKPGYLLKEDFIDHSLSKRSVIMCHFCRKQVYKMKKEGVLPRSLYCPTDLFSGCPRRMQHAVKMLLQTPRNNIRIFKDQKLIYAEERKSDLEEILVDFFRGAKLSCIDMLCRLLIEVLLKPLSCKDEETVQFPKQCEVLRCSNAHPGCNLNGLCHTLPSDCVLGRILRVQMLDNLDIQNMHSLLDEIKQYGEQNSNRIGYYSRSEIPSHLGEKGKAEGETDYQYASRKIWEFTVALVAKDCSIMLVLKNYTGSDNNHNPNLVSDDFGKLYLFSVAVLDLEPKPLNRIEKHYKRTPKWLQACLSMSV